MLLQIEEPSAKPDDEPPDPGLAIGIELTDTSLRIAISIGGNAEIVPGAQGGDFLPAIMAYDADGDRVVGDDAVALAHDPARGPSWVGHPALAQPDAVDARGATAIDRLSLLVLEAKRRVERAARRFVTRAVVVAPITADQAARLALIQAIEAAGIEVLRLIDRPLALAWGGGLDRSVDGVYLGLLRRDGDAGAALVELEGGRLRLIAAVPAVDDGDLRAAIAAALEQADRAPASLAGVFCDGSVDPATLPPGLATRPIHLDAPGVAVLGAALAAEAWS
ncbi:MAG TPA: Hsp70 family protein [Stellaceae bacterium]|nr:Hsp70 family protein [Stellaceae bacterium]